MNRGEEIVQKYILIIKEYLYHMMQSQTLKTIDNSTYIIIIGLNTIIHVFKIMLSTTKDIDKTYIQCQKAYYCYLEYIEQMNKTNFLHNLNNLNAILFVYKKTVAIEGFAKPTAEQKPSTSPYDEANSISNIPLMNVFFSQEEYHHSPYRKEQLPSEGFTKPLEGFVEPLENRRFSDQTEQNLDSFPRISKADSEKNDVFYTLNLISSATKTILFFTDELYFETEENRIKNTDDNSKQNYIDKTISIEEIIQLVENHLRKILLLYISSHSKECTVDSSSIISMQREYEGFAKETNIFNYINLLQEKLVIDYEIYDKFLLEFYKKIKQLKRAKKIPTTRQINTNSLKYFYQEENLNDLKKLLETKKYNEFVKILFTF